MPNIAIIDDRPKMRQTILRYIALELKELDQHWGVIDSAPLPLIDDYREWIVANDVGVLILDENLNENFDDGEAVDYAGHNVAERLRVQIPDLPQFIVTSIPQPEDLDEAGAAALDAIIKRDDFAKRSKVYVERMLRAGSTFTDRHEGELAELSELSTRMVEGSAQPHDYMRLAALREKFSLDRDQSANTLKDLAEEIVFVRDEIQGILEGLAKEPKKN